MNVTRSRPADAASAEDQDDLPEDMACAKHLSLPGQVADQAVQRATQSIEQAVQQDESAQLPQRCPASLLQVLGAMLSKDLLLQELHGGTAWPQRAEIRLGRFRFRGGWGCSTESGDCPSRVGQIVKHDFEDQMSESAVATSTTCSSWRCRMAGRQRCTACRSRCQFLRCREK